MSLINSFANPAHEKEVAKVAKKVLPGVPVSLSSDVVPEMQEYERTNTTVVNSYVRPRVQTYMKNLHRQLKKRMKEAVECAKRVNAKWTTVVPGTFVNNIEWDYQTANVIDTLKMCSEILEPEGIVMVLEPLNPWANHPGCFLSKIPQARPRTRLLRPTRLPSNRCLLPRS